MKIIKILRKKFFFDFPSLQRVKADPEPWFEKAGSESIYGQFVLVMQARWVMPYSRLRPFVSCSCKSYRNKFYISDIRGRAGLFD